MTDAGVKVRGAGRAFAGLHRARHASTVVSLQYVRAMAACSVMYTHIFNNRICVHWDAYKLFGASGVSTFFLISGFIMWSSTRRRHGGAWRFLRRRVLRVYPLWWIALTVWIVLRLLIPDGMKNADMTPFSVIASYALAPHFHTVLPYPWPILVPGWTLQLEIMFYVLLAAVLFIHAERRRFLALAALLAAFLALGLVVHARSAVLVVYTDPLLVEFLAGIVLAMAFSRLGALPWQLGATLVGAGIVSVLLLPADMPKAGWMHLVLSGVPALAIVSGALIMERMIVRRPIAGLLSVGDASYSLYLFHPIAIAAVAVVWHKCHFPEGASRASLCFIPLAFAASIVASLLVYRWVEKPLTGWLLPSRPSVPALPDRDLLSAQSA